MSRSESKHPLLIFLPLAVSVEDGYTETTVSVLVFRCLFKHMGARAVFGTLFSEGLRLFCNFSLSPLTLFLSLPHILLSFALSLACLMHLKTLRHLFGLLRNLPTGSLYLTFLLFKSKTRQRLFRNRCI